MICQLNPALEYTMFIMSLDFLTPLRINLHLQIPTVYSILSISTRHLGTLHIPYDVYYVKLFCNIPTTLPAMAGSIQLHVSEMGLLCFDR